MGQNNSDFKQIWKTFMEDSVFKHASISFTVRDAETRKIIFSHDPDRSLTPASTLKLLTTAACLGILGENFKFKTIFSYDGNLIKDTLNGNIVIQAGKDPTLGSEKFGTQTDEILKKVIEQLKHLNITCITGTVKITTPQKIANPIPPFWSWTDIGNYYGAGVWSINFSDNQYFIKFKIPPRQGEKTEIIEINPDFRITFENYVVAGQPGSKDNAYIFTSPFSTHAIITGTLPADKRTYTIKGSLPNPPLYFTEKLITKLKENGITVLNHNHNRVGNEVKNFYTHFSPPLAEIIRVTNQKSINLYAEALLLALDTAREYVSFESAIKILLKYYKSLGLSVDGIAIYDGSGLSVANHVHSSFLSDVLAIITKQSYFNAFYHSLAVAGKVGTLEKIGKNTFAEGNLRGKSGNMKGVISYCGYVKNKNGRLQTFSLIINNFTVPNSVVLGKVEKILVSLTELF
jgi:D-alanyl-D-alanine carboxypeptidase/D-alanyl-D-alanine-endopeptidase (penicillin-binding protein 4)